MSNQEPRESEITDLPERPQEQVSPEDEANTNGGAGTSAYTGETEKNINQLFGQAPRSNAKLLFDEGDSLFK
jgi:SpoVK/Ycf46/Vps4 family AAA+-type ATPase